MRIVFSEHAENRIKERGISKLKVVATVKKPDEIWDSYRERKIYRRKFHDYTLEVVVKNENFLVVISAYVIK